MHSRTRTRALARTNAAPASCLRSLWVHTTIIRVGLCDDYRTILSYQSVSQQSGEGRRTGRARWPSTRQRRLVRLLLLPQRRWLRSHPAAAAATAAAAAAAAAAASAAATAAAAAVAVASAVARLGRSPRAAPRAPRLSAA